MSLIEFQSITKKFGKIVSIKDVNFKIERGTLTTIVGPNGAGKTTIARIMLGLEQPTSGLVIKELDITLSYVPQKINFNPNLPVTTKEFLNFLSQNNSQQMQFGQLAQFMDFVNIANTNVSQLSGGQLQKLLLVASLLNKPDLIILDEPIQSLDIASQKQFYDLIDNCRKSNPDLTIFMISHDLLMVMKNSDQVICLNGHVCCSGKPGDDEQNPEFINILSSLGIYNHHHNHRH
ncbi:MAG: metal ABC transporter ATP-binding protein [Rickettsiaceae bacterium]|nr:MAG: metal ABC transporter ATP-binding protein [Rickettsiaceae bacterium]